MAKGEYAAVLDYDDLATPERLLRQVPVLMEQPEVGVVGGAVDFVDQTARTFAVVQYPTESAEVRKTLTSGSPLVHSAATIRRSVLSELGGYRPSFRVALDYDLWTRVAEHYEIVNVPHVVTRYRIRAGQSSNDIERVALELLAARKSAHARRAGLNDPVPEELLESEELMLRLHIGSGELGAEIARYGTWYGKTLAMAGSGMAASEVFDAAHAGAQAAGDAALVKKVAEARRAVRTTRLSALKAQVRRASHATRSRSSFHRAS